MHTKERGLRIVRGSGKKPVGGRKSKSGDAKLTCKTHHICECKAEEMKRLKERVNLSEQIESLKREKKELQEVVLELMKGVNKARGIIADLCSGDCGGPA